jgi:hypothetical protein
VTWTCASVLLELRLRRGLRMSLHSHSHWQMLCLATDAGQNYYLFVSIRASA